MVATFGGSPKNKLYGLPKKVAFPKSVKSRNSGRELQQPQLKVGSETPPVGTLGGDPLFEAPLTCGWISVLV